MRRGGERGFVLLVTVIVMSVIGLISFSSVARLLSTAQFSDDRTAGLQAYYAAASAREAALLYLSEEPGAANFDSGVFGLFDTGNSLRAQYIYSVEDTGGFALFADIEAGEDYVYFWHDESGGALGRDGSASSHAAGVETADVNKSGFLDIVAAAGGKEFAVFTNEGAGNFTFDALYEAGGDISCFVPADVNGDGNFDIVVGTDAGNIEVWLNDGGGFFERDDVYDAGGGIVCVAVSDLDGDGFPDIVVGTDEGGGKIEVWFNGGAGSFIWDAAYAPGGAPLCIALSDLDGDGLPDIVVGTAAEEIEVWLNDGGGSFSRDDVYDAGGAVACIAVGDINNNGLSDIAAGVGSRVGVWSNEGGGKFWTDDGSGREDSVVYYSLPVGRTAVSLFLWEGDYPDITVGTDVLDIRFFKNDGFGVFEPVAVESRPHGRLRRLPVKKITASGYYPEMDEYRAVREIVVYAVRPREKYIALTEHNK